MGHVMEKILADVIVRWMRLKGDAVRFHIGTDENGIKIQQTAKTLGMTPKELVEKNAPVFRDLFERIGISFDTFIRTADAESHWPTVKELWKRLREAGYLEKRTYSGLYCTGCERFLTPKDLVDGLCPDHQKAPELVTEENWFFLLKKKQKDIERLLKAKKGGYTMLPSWRGKETLNFLEGGLEDVSFSRSRNTLSWGVPVPDDSEQVMYVWCDNLTSYISSLGLLTDHPMSEWWDEATVTHVIGKDIARFHAINWPAMLQVALIRTPDRLLIHGFLTSEGQKMSKSIGNVVEPEQVLTHFHGNPDPLRFYLSHEIPVGNDGDFSWKRIDELYDSKLRNQLGNLLNRVLVLLKKEGGSIVLPQDCAEDRARAKEGWERFSASMDSMEVHRGIQQAFELVALLNGAMDTLKPWTLTGEAKIHVLSRFAESLRHVALMLLPFMPGASRNMCMQLGVPYATSVGSRDFVITNTLKKFGAIKEWKTIGEPAILFEKLW